MTGYRENQAKQDYEQEMIDKAHDLPHDLVFYAAVRLINDHLLDECDGNPEGVTVTEVLKAWAEKHPIKPPEPIKHQFVIELPGGKWLHRSATVRNAFHFDVEHFGIRIALENGIDNLRRSRKHWDKR